MAEERCPVCDRVECDVADSESHKERIIKIQVCRSNAIDWRARALEAEQRLAEVERERDNAKALYGAELEDHAETARLGREFRAHLFNVGVAMGLAPRGPVDGPEVVSAACDVAANRQWLLDEHVPALKAETDTLRAALADATRTVEAMRPVVEAAVAFDGFPKTHRALVIAADAYRSAKKETP